MRVPLNPKPYTLHPKPQTLEELNFSLAAADAVMQMGGGKRQKGAYLLR